MKFMHAQGGLPIPGIEHVMQPYAFGEGFGYAFAAMVLDNPNARDSFVDNGTLRSGGFNIEDNPPAPNDPTGCWCSESSVWAILYDIYDTAADAGDTLALGFGPIWDVLVGEQRTTPAFTSIFTFITALKAGQPASVTGINSLVSAQNIVTNTNAFGTTETNQGGGDLGADADGGRPRQAGAQTRSESLFISHGT